MLDCAGELRSEQQLQDWSRVFDTILGNSGIMYFGGMFKTKNPGTLPSETLKHTQGVCKRSQYFRTHVSALQRTSQKVTFTVSDTVER